MPSQRFTTANELHLPVGKTVHIELRVGRRDPQLLGAESGRQARSDPGPHQHHRAHAAPASARSAASARNSAACSTRNGAATCIVDTPADFEAWRQRQLQPRSDLPSDVAQARRAAVRGQPRARCATPIARHRRARTIAARPDPSRQPPHARRRHAAVEPRRSLRAGSPIRKRSSPAPTCPTIDLEPDQLTRWSLIW